MNIFKEMGIYDGSDRVNEEVLYNVARAYSVIDKAMSKLLVGFDLSPAKFNILMMVKHVGKEIGISQKELSRLVLVTTSNITRMIDKLEKDKYVDRIPQIGDRRVNLLRITKKGADLLDEVWPRYDALVRDLTDNKLSGPDKRRINRLLEQFITGIK